MPEISVIVPIYNVEKYLPKCIDSLLEQTFSDFEAICVNDGSPDNSAKILEEYSQKDKRINIITRENGGLSAARNSGMDKATGKYIYFLDSDDYLHPQALEIMHKTITFHDADFTTCLYQPVYQDTTPEIKKYDFSYSKAKIITNPLSALLCKKSKIHINVWTKLYKASTLKDQRFYSGICYEDLHFNPIFFEKSQKGVYIDLPLYFYLKRGDSIMGSDFTIKKSNDYFAVIRDLHRHFTQSKEPLSFQQKNFLNQIAKYVIKFSNRSSNKDEISIHINKEIKSLYEEGIISYKGLSLRQKLILWKIIKCK